MKSNKQIFIRFTNDEFQLFEKERVRCFNNVMNSTQFVKFCAIKGLENSMEGVENEGNARK